MDFCSLDHCQLVLTTTDQDHPTSVVSETLWPSHLAIMNLLLSKSPDLYLVHFLFSTHQLWVPNVSLQSNTSHTLTCVIVKRQINVVCLLFGNVFGSSFYASEEKVTITEVPKKIEAWVRAKAAKKTSNRQHWQNQNGQEKPHAEHGCGENVFGGISQVDPHKTSRSLSELLIKESAIIKGQIIHPIHPNAFPQCLRVDPKSAVTNVSTMSYKQPTWTQ